MIVFWKSQCHEYNYVETITQMCSSIPDHPSAIAHLDADTTMSRWSFEAALRAAGSVCEAVDKVMSGDFRNSFCAVRPPGHHAGPRGIVRCPNDPDGGSHGFCFLNNVAIGAAYARSMYRNDGIRKIAIVDFDVHHGNGTEEIIRQLVPTVEKSIVRTPFAVGELGVPRYRPWLDETDVHNVFFASTHGYGPRGIEFADTPQGGWFYPASGETHTSDSIKNPAVVETPNMTDFLLSQTWTRMGEDALNNCCKILNCGLGLPAHDAIPGMQRLEVRDTYRKRILPHLREFDPDIIFISAGFDAHKRDSMNFGYVGMVEDDYEWVTEQLVRIANSCCNGRIVSVLEGGYKIHGGIVSPFARSVAAHVRSLVDGASSRELYDLKDGEWESQFERHLIDERERKRQQKIEKMKLIEAQNRRALQGDDAGNEDEDDAAPRKRKRNQVDYRELYEQMKKEGFAT
jgi:acetoin utilization deacetylase AcuC-like enzyme